MVIVRTSLLVLMIIVTCNGTNHDLIIMTDLDNGTIYTGPIGTLQFTLIPLQDVRRPVAVDYDPTEQRVYWTDVVKRTINRAFINGTGQEELLRLSNILGAQSVPDGITIDSDNRHVYWTDAGLNRIERANLDGSGREIIIQDNLDQPRAIVVDPPGRHIYWTDWGDNQKIERSKLDGTEREILVDSGLAFPNGIDVDFEEQRIYWCDAGTNKLESIDLNGANRRINFFVSTPDIHPFDIGVYKDNIYWTDWAVTRLIEVSKGGGTAEPVGSVTFLKAGGLHIHQEHDGSCSTNMCENNSRCRQLPSGYQCACLPGFTGTYCEINIDECNSNPCIIGQCRDGINRYTCDCPTGLTGELCDIDIDECLSTPCQNGGACHDLVGSFRCDCPSGYDGDRCESRSIKGCFHPGEIEHGYVISGDYSSEAFPPGKRIEYLCEDGYDLQGARVIFCQTDSTWSHEMPQCVKEHEGLNTAAIIGGGVGVGLIIVILIVILLVVCFKKNKTTGTNNLLEQRRQDPRVPKTDTRPFTSTPASGNTAHTVNMTYEPDPLYSSRLSMQQQQQQQHRSLASGIYDEIPDWYELPSRFPPNPQYDKPPSGYPPNSRYDRPPSRYPPNPPSYDSLRRPGSENADVAGDEVANGEEHTKNNDKNECSANNENMNEESPYEKMAKNVVIENAVRVPPNNQ